MSKSDQRPAKRMSRQQRLVYLHLQMADGQPLTKRQLEERVGSERIAARVGELIHEFDIPVEGVWMRDVHTKERVYGYRLAVGSVPKKPEPEPVFEGDQAVMFELQPLQKEAA